MPAYHLDSVLRFLHHMVYAEQVHDLTDADLLRRFVSDREESAFTLLVQRHGPMVLGVCQRVLHNLHAAEDAFQATFVVLARRAASLHGHGSLASWLYGVAWRVARTARLQVATRQRHERQVASMPRRESFEQRTWEEVRVILDEEIAALPEKLRAPLVLHYLEQKTQAQAAAALACPRSTLRDRLEQGRELLRQRLLRRGVTLSVSALAAVLAEQAAPAAVPALLTLAAVRAVTAGTLSEPVAALAKGVIQTMVVSKLKLVTGVVFVLGALASGTVGLARQARTQLSPVTKPRQPAASQPEPTAERASRFDRYGDPLPEGALGRLGTVRWRYGEWTYHLAYSPDGKVVASAGVGLGLCLWDAATGKALRSWPQIEQVWGVAISPDSKTLAFGSNQTIHFADLATGKELRTCEGHARLVSCVAFAPDGKTLLSGSFDQTVRLWDTATGRELKQFQANDEHVYSVAFSPDGKRVASGHQNGMIHLWDPVSGQEIGPLKGHTMPAMSVAFSPDGRTLASGSEDGTCRLWDMATRAPLRRCGNGEGWVHAVAFAPDGKTLASAGYDRKIHLWDPASGEERRQWEATVRGVDALAFSPDGKALLSGAIGESAVRLWDPTTGKELRRTPGHTGLIDSLRFAPDGKTLLSHGYDKRVWLWDLASGRGQGFFGGPLAPVSDPYALPAGALSPDGTLVASGGRVNGEVRLWDRATGHERRLLGRHPAGVVAIAFSGDGTLLASGARDGSLRVWEVGTGREAARLQFARPECVSLAFSPDNRILAFGVDTIRSGPAPSVHLWDLAAGKVVRSLPYGGTVSRVAFSSDGRMLATTAWYAAQTRVWEVATGQELRPLAEQPEGTYDIAFSPDDKLVVAGGFVKDSGVHLWEVGTGRKVRRFDGHRGSVHGLGFSPDGRILATGGLDSTVLLWDLTGLYPDTRLPNPRPTTRELDLWWTALAGNDTIKAFDAIWALISRPSQTLPFLKERLHPVQTPDVRRVQKLVTDLDSESFAVRRTATEELEKLGDFAEPTLRQALA